MRRAPELLIRIGPVVFALALALYVATVMLWPDAQWNQIDMRTYRGGAEYLLAGGSLYQGPVFQALNFIYPPFAAILFVPLALLPTSVDRWLTCLGELGLLYVIGMLCWRRMTTARGADLVKLSLLTVGVGLWMDPIRITAYLGQVNTVLVVLVLLDLYYGGRRFGGIGLGLAAGIKLTPLIFLPFLLVTRRFREAATALLVFATTVLLGLVVTPSNTIEYWIKGAFHNADRISNPGSPSNQTINGLLIRMVGAGEGETVLWLGCAALAAVAGIGLARLAYRRGEPLLALTLVGMTGAAVSPFSWNHHWVWVIGLAIWLLSLGRRKGYLLFGVCYLACLSFLDAYPPPSDTLQVPLSGWQFLPVSGWPRAVIDNTWVLIYLGALLVACWWLVSDARKHHDREPEAVRTRTPVPAA